MVGNIHSNAPIEKTPQEFDMEKSLIHVRYFCSVIKKARDDYVKRLNGIYERNLNNVSILFSHFKY